MLFEVPQRLDGSDGSDDDCPELLCTGCDSAIFLAPVVVWSFMRPRDKKVAPRQRRAA